MAFSYVKFRSAAHSYVKFYKRHITFEEKLLETFDLDQCEHLELGVDIDLKRVYFKFMTDASQNSLELHQRHEGKGDRSINARLLYGRYEWLASIPENKANPCKRFLMREVQDRTDVPDGYDLYIDARSPVYRGVKFDPNEFPREKGVYWLLDEYGDVVRIGESDNLASALYAAWQTYGRDIKRFDYEVIGEARNRLKKQKDYVREHADEYGAEPKYNPLLLKKKGKK
jgi:hypothetical protein